MQPEAWQGAELASRQSASMENSEALDHGSQDSRDAYTYEDSQGHSQPPSHRRGPPLCSHCSELPFQIIIMLHSYTMQNILLFLLPSIPALEWLSARKVTS